MRSKAITLLLLWLTIGLTVIFGIQNTIVRIILVIVALGVTLHVSRLKTRKQ